MIDSPPEPMAKVVNLLGIKHIYLKVDIPQSNTEGPEFKVPPLGGCPPSILIASPVRPPSSKAGEVTMTTEVRELLSWVVLVTSEHASGSSTPKRWEPRNDLAARPSCQRLFAAMARRAAYHQEREVWMSHLHWHNY